MGHGKPPFSCPPFSWVPGGGRVGVPVSVRLLGGRDACDVPSVLLSPLAALPPGGVCVGDDGGSVGAYVGGRVELLPCGGRTAKGGLDSLSPFRHASRFLGWVHVPLCPLAGEAMAGAGCPSSLLLPWGGGVFCGAGRKVGRPGFWCPLSPGILCFDEGGRWGSGESQQASSD